MYLNGDASIFSGADNTDEVDGCANLGCGFNVDGKCTATGTECFGYIEPVE